MKKSHAAGGQKGPQGRKSTYLSGVMSIYVVLVLTGQLLIYDDYYYNILQAKYYYFCACTIGMLLLVLLHGVSEILRRGICPPKQWPARIREWLKGKNLWNTRSAMDAVMIVFTVLVTISTLLSPFPFEAFWGNEGRYTGAFMLYMSVLIYFCISRWYRLKWWHIELFLVAGMLMCLFGISDYFCMDLLHFKEEMEPTQLMSFTSFIGNINTYTACVALVMAVAGILFASCDHVAGIIWYGICVFISFFAMITGQSENAYLALIAFFGFLPLYLFRSRKGFYKYLLLLAMFFSTLQCVAWTQAYPEAIQLTGLFDTLTEYEKLPEVVRCLWILVGVLYASELALWAWKRWKNSSAAVGSAAAADVTAVGKQPAAAVSGNKERKKHSAWIARAWWLVIIAVCVVIAYAVYDATILGNGEKYGALQKYVQFNDAWGTHRGYIWKLAVRDYKEYEPLQKIFGYGPDTFALVTWFNNREEMISLYNERFDSVHNEFLQFFVTIGPMGLITYLGIILISLWNAVKHWLDNPYFVGAMFAVICYNVQAVVNINQPIATPVMWLFLCICMAQPAMPGGRWPWEKAAE